MQVQLCLWPQRLPPLKGSVCCSYPTITASYEREGAHAVPTLPRHDIHALHHGSLANIPPSTLSPLSGPDLLVVFAAASLWIGYSIRVFWLPCFALIILHHRAKATSDLAFQDTLNVNTDGHQRVSIGLSPLINMHSLMNLLQSIYRARPSQTTVPGQTLRRQLSGEGPTLAVGHRFRDMAVPESSGAGRHQSCREKLVLSTR